MEIMAARSQPLSRLDISGEVPSSGITVGVHAAPSPQ